MTKKVAFVDTMLFLHFRHLDQIDWPRLLGAEQVDVLLAPVVARQLDRHKDQHPVQGLRERARNGVARLKSWLGDSSEAVIRPGVVLRLVHSDPQIDFAAHQLSRDVEDDQLIASAIQHRATTGEDVVIVTDDFLLKATKARAAGFPAIAPDEIDRLPEGVSEQEKKLKALQAENQALKSRRPKLKVSFESGDDHLTVALRPVGPMTEAQREQLLARERERYPLSIPEEQSHGPGWDSRESRSDGDRMRALLNAISQGAEEKHNQEIERYLSDYAAYLERVSAHLQMKARSVTFTIRLSNSGTAPASDIDFTAQTRDLVRAYEKGAPRLRAPRVPKEPDLSPEHSIFRLPYSPLAGRTSLAMRNFHSALAPVSAVVRNLKGGGFRIKAEVKKLKHLQHEDFGPYVMVFPSNDAIRPIQLHYKLNCDDLAENLEGVLHLNVSAVPSPIDDVPKP